MKNMDFVRGGLFKRYAVLTRHCDGEIGLSGIRYFTTWKQALASAGYFSLVKQEIYVWNSLYEEWYKVLEVK